MIIKEEEMNEYYEEHGDKLLCRDCGEMVYPKIEREFVGEPGHGGYQEWEVCPCCGGGDMTEARMCGNCMKYIPVDEDYCEDCIEEVKKVIRNATEEYDSELRDLAMTQMVEG
jgi:predicted amidophosphoribosyltransferase